MEVAEEFAAGLGFGFGGDAGGSADFHFEKGEGTAVGVFLGQVPEEAVQQVEEFRAGVFGFGGELDEFGGVGGEKEAQVMLADGGVRFEQTGVDEGVEFAFAAGAQADLAQVEEVELTGEGAFVFARAFGDGFDAPVFGGEEADDEARLGEFRFAQNDGAGGCVEGQHGGRVAQVGAGAESFLRGRVERSGATSPAVGCPKGMRGGAEQTTRRVVRMETNGHMRPCVPT